MRNDFGGGKKVTVTFREDTDNDGDNEYGYEYGYVYYK